MKSFITFHRRLFLMNFRRLSVLFSFLYTAIYVPVMLKQALEQASADNEKTTQYLRPPPPTMEASNHQTHLLPKPDGSFNGFNLYKVYEPPHTDIHCVGENFQDNRSYMFRSCRYETFCFDTKLREFVVYPDRPLNASTYGEIYTSTHNPENYTAVVPGAMNRDWWPVKAEKVHRIKTSIGRYQPKFVYPGSYDVPTSYYRFNATWLPFYRHQRSAYNPGHLIWDDFLALYTLLDIFDQTDDTLMLSHMIRKATNDFEGDSPLPDNDLITKFMPLVGKYNYPLQTLEGDYKLTLHGKVLGRKDLKKRRVICADNALLGNGMFSDNGDHWHGDIESDYNYPNNNGRGGLFRRYREWIMNHIGIDPNTQIQREPYLIVVSKLSSTKGRRRRVKFNDQINALQKGLGNRAAVKYIQLSEMTLLEQATLFSKTAIFISMVGGGTVSGTFLPKGASTIFYVWDERFLDWDFWNNFPQIKTHWFQYEDMTEASSLEALVDTVRNQLDYLDRH